MMWAMSEVFRAPRAIRGPRTWQKQITVNVMQYDVQPCAFGLAA